MRYILVTGARGGMGSAAVKKLAERGYTVFALDVFPGKAENNIIPIEADVTNEDSLKNALSSVRTMTDELFAIVHYAGIYMLDSLVEMETEEFDKICGVNLRGAFLVNKLFFPLLGNGSRIVMTTSELADIDPLPFTGIYAVTKAALDKYAYSLAMELQLLGINVSVIRAGAVKPVCSEHRLKRLIRSALKQKHIYATPNVLKGSLTAWKLQMYRRRESHS